MTIDLSTIYSLAGNQPQGFIASQVPNVHVFWSQCAMSKHMQAYEFGLVFILQGHKVGFIGDQFFQYGSGHYLAVGLPLHFECETHLEDSKPLLGIYISLDETELSSLAIQMMANQALPSTLTERVGVEPLAITTPMYDVLQRILNVLNDTQSGSVLGNLYIQELCYYVLQASNSTLLLNHLKRSTAQNRVGKAIAMLSENIQQKFSTPELAQYANMSVASFNRYFKQLTGQTVSVYCKTIRLTHARFLLNVKGLTVNQTAEQIGYGSAAQFSREFKAYFGVPPKMANRITH